MNTWKISPSSKSVAAYIDCYWMLEKTSRDSSFTHPKLNPDPAAHLILCAPQQAYRYEHDSGVFTGKGSHWILPHSKTLCMDHSNPFIIAGIKFHVGALYALSSNAKHTELNQIINVNKHCFLSGILNFTKLPVNNPNQCRDIIDATIAPHLSNKSESKNSQLVRKILLLLSNTPLSELSLSLNCSRRSIERNFLRATGMTIRQYQSMNKLEDILEHLAQIDNTNINWSDIAIQFGFTDQPHLIRYIKTNIGVTPGQYAKERNLTIDVYGNFE